MKKKIGFKKQLEEFPSSLQLTTPIDYLESKVRFTLRNCDINKFCIRKLDSLEIRSFYSRLAFLESLTWQQVKQIPHEKGFSSEKKESPNHAKLSSMFEDLSSFFHFRVNGTPNPFRVFAAQKEDLCYLLWIDRKGEINH